MAKKWTDEEIKLLKENYPYMDCNELYDLLNKNRSIITLFILIKKKNHKLINYIKSPFTAVFGDFNF